MLAGRIELPLSRLKVEHIAILSRQLRLHCLTEMPACARHKFRPVDELSFCALPLLLEAGTTRPRCISALDTRHRLFANGTHLNHKLLSHIRGWTRTSILTLRRRRLCPVELRESRRPGNRAYWT